LEAFPEQLGGTQGAQSGGPPSPSGAPLGQNGTAMPCSVAHKLMHKPIKTEGACYTHAGLV